ncbi:stimulus-sensing domain-containing protein [Notoacmeibacter sp. MSK16QG-6]|uniref:stimulus-sensing domain-containing protein n=1 Tax=Notoacmeibacter sp. MSK16QG-6 TaxID=2957982 RepID=UPI00273A6299|nr:stimulus-sensing domain-containing protein [Notoacmeibacter sp. MSK16QG-6]
MAAPRRRNWRNLPFSSLRFARRATRYLVLSSIARRILFLNLVGLGVLVVGILYLNQYREGLIEAKVESLSTQARIIAGAIAASATVETDSLQIDPEKLLELQAGQSIVPSSDGLDSLVFPINPERVAPVLRRLISPTRTRARVYDRDGNILLDSQQFYSRGQILRYDLPKLEPAVPTIFDRLEAYFLSLFGRDYISLDHEEPGVAGSNYSEVTASLTGEQRSVVRRNTEGETIIAVAVPIQRFRAVLGALQLSTIGGDIDDIIRSERTAILAVFGVAAAVTIFLSFLLASTIAKPLRRLSAAAMRVKRGVKERQEIPDFSDRGDEIGHLSGSLRSMTEALYNRIEAIERFAADVAHELKNPLTSLRSAVETLPLAKNEASRQRLLEVIEHDVRRLDRLITDISDASRLDAELARVDAEPIDLRKLLSDIVEVDRQTAKVHSNARLSLTMDDDHRGKRAFVVSGHDLRLGQVFSNLIGNARSFVPDRNGNIAIELFRRGSRVIIWVEDNGPGIGGENIERIFERFYTDRPEGEAFGQNSGLGLSISRQIVEAHGGQLTAENIVDEEAENGVGGARFIIDLPARH